MRATAKLIFTLALVCAVAQASLVENLLSNTKFKGKGSMNMTNGLSMGYQGGITFNMAGKEINLVDLGVNFNAVPEVAKVGDTTSATVKYTGALTFAEATNTSTTNVTVAGTTAVNLNTNVTTDNTTGTTTVVVNQTVTDTNSFVIRSGVNQVTAKGSESLSTLSTVVQKGDCVKVNSNTGLSASVRGSAVSNGTSLGAFTALTSTTSNTSQSASLHKSGWLPNVTYSGKTGFANENYLSFQGTTYNTSKNGAASFVGASNIKTNSSGLGVVTRQGLLYNYKSNVAVNNTVTNTSSVNGVGKILSVVESNGTSSGIFSAGKIYQVAHNTDGNGSSSAKPVVPPRKPVGPFRPAHGKVVVDESEEATELCVKPHPHPHPHPRPPKPTPGPKPHPPKPTPPKPDPNSYYQAIAGGWKFGATTATTVTSNTTATTNTTAGLGYKVDGIDTRSWKPWSVSGKESVTTSFKTTQLSSKAASIDDVVVASANTNAAFQKKMNELNVADVDKSGIYFPSKPRL